MNEMECEVFHLGHVQEWMILETCAFFVNMIVLSFNLLLSIAPSQKVKKIIFTRRIKRANIILQTVIDHDIKDDQYKIIDERNMGIL
jgi:hypothetical protein